MKRADEVIGERSHDLEGYAKRAKVFERKRDRAISVWGWINGATKMLIFFFLILFFLMIKNAALIWVPLVMIGSGYVWAYSDRKKRGD